MTTSHYIAGRWVEGQGNDSISVYDPSLGAPFAELRSASSAQVDEAGNIVLIRLAADRR